MLQFHNFSGVFAYLTLSFFFSSASQAMNVRSHRNSKWRARANRTTEEPVRITTVFGMVGKR